MSLVPDKVLIVRLGAIGDVVNALSFAKALKASARPPEIGWVVHDLAAPLLRDNPLVDRVHLWKRGSGFGGMGSVVREVRVQRYGLAVDLQRLLKSALLARLSGAPRVLGWDRARAKEGAWLFANERIGAGGADTHMVASYGEFAAKLGVEALGPDGVLSLDPVAQQRFRDLAGTGSGRRIAINLGASKPGNQWPAERFGQVAKALTAAGNQVFLVGGPGDLASGAVAAKFGGPGVIDLVGQTNLPELAALLSTCDLFIGCDTGPMHMAVAVGCRTIAIFGPANPRRTGPFMGMDGQANHTVLQHMDAGDWRSARTDSVSVDEVLTTALATQSSG